MTDVTAPFKAKVWYRHGRWWWRVFGVYGEAASHTCNYSGHVDGAATAAHAADEARPWVRMLNSPETWDFS